jgi:(4S)-4-hydroxy-5-phosphonooxypentane-2,3-dione isomerase
LRALRGFRPVERDGTPVPRRIMVNELHADEAAVATHEANPRMASVGAAIKPPLAWRRLILAQVLSIP